MTEIKSPALRVKERLPEEREGMTHRFEIGGKKFYLTYNEYDNGRLSEIFLKGDKAGSIVHGLLNCFAISVSIALQHGVAFGHLFNKFSYQDFEPNGTTNQLDIPMAKSVIDYVFRWLDMRYDEHGFKREKHLVRKAGLLVKG